METQEKCIGVVKLIYNTINEGNYVVYEIHVGNDDLTNISEDDAKIIYEKLGDFFISEELI